MRCGAADDPSTLRELRWRRAGPDPESLQRGKLFQRSVPRRAAVASAGTRSRATALRTLRSPTGGTRSETLRDPSRSSSCGVPPGDRGDNPDPGRAHPPPQSARISPTTNRTETSQGALDPLPRLDNAGITDQGHGEGHFFNVRRDKQTIVWKRRQAPLRYSAHGRCPASAGAKQQSGRRRHAGRRVPCQHPQDT